MKVRDPFIRIFEFGVGLERRIWDSFFFSYLLLSSTLFFFPSFFTWPSSFSFFFSSPAWPAEDNKEKKKNSLAPKHRRHRALPHRHLLSLSFYLLLHRASSPRSSEPRARHPAETERRRARPPRVAEHAGHEETPESERVDTGGFNSSRNEVKFLLPKLKFKIRVSWDWFRDFVIPGCLWGIDWRWLFFLSSCFDD